MNRSMESIMMTWSSPGKKIRSLKIQHSFVLPAWDPPLINGTGYQNWQYWTSSQLWFKSITLLKRAEDYTPTWQEFLYHGTKIYAVAQSWLLSAAWATIQLQATKKYRYLTSQHGQRCNNSLWHWFRKTCLYLSWEENTQDIFETSKEPVKKLDTMFHPKI